MPLATLQQPGSDSTDGQSAIQCDACESAVHAESQQDVSFLLLDQLTIPVIGCDDHLERFSSICGLTTDDTADLLEHRPAGGICCPSCRLAPYNSSYPMIPVQGGAIVAMACPEHQTEITQRFQTGLQTHQRLSTDFNTDTSPSL